ncbi:MAG: dienelactone hydrolase family protein [Pseudomonadota bacterium]
MSQHTVTETDDQILVEPTQDCAGAVIWLHGLGADGHDFLPVVEELSLEAPLRFVFPHAEERPVTINGGMRMRAWYDIDPQSPLSGTEDIVASAARLSALVETQKQAGVPAERIVVAGFSQGGVIALQHGLRTNERLGGIMALSTYVHDHEHLTDEITLASLDAPIFMVHGINDPMIPITRAITGREALRALNYNLEWHEYQMGHQVCMEELRDISTWLNGVFNA